jgi:hypothetical protein
MVALGLCPPAPARAHETSDPARPPESALDRALHALDEEDRDAALPLLTEALGLAADHHKAYGRLVQLAIEARDEAALARLVAAHRAFPFELPERFQQRVQYFELGPLRRASNQAIQAALARNWLEAEQGFSLLLGDEAFHRHAVTWLFRIAMQRRDFDRARFVAGLAYAVGDDPAASADVLAACAAQRVDERQPSFGHLIRELGRRGGYSGSPEARVAAQRSVYLAMVRLHVELDQCFLNGMTRVEEARPLFPDLPDAVLAYLARPAPASSH